MEKCKMCDMTINQSLSCNHNFCPKCISELDNVCPECIGKLDYVLSGIGLSNSMLREKGEFEGKDLSTEDFQ